MKFTDPNMFIHVRYNPVKNQSGSSLRAYEVVEANTNKKITTLKSLGKVTGPLIFDDGSRVEGANYQKLLDFLKKRDVYINCLGRILVTSLLHEEYQPPPRSPPEIDCFRVHDYFPWHKYGGPLNLEIDKSWVALDLEQSKVEGASDPRITRGTYLLIDNVPIETSSLGPSANWGLEFSPEQIASKDYGFSFELDPVALNLWNSCSRDNNGTDPTPRISVFTSFGESFARPINAGQYCFITMFRVEDGSRRCTVAWVSGPKFSRVGSVDTSIWRRTGENPRFRTLIFESKPGCIWSA